MTTKTVKGSSSHEIQPTILDALSACLTQRIDILLNYFKAADRETDASRVTAIAHQIRTTAEEIAELANWIYAPRKPLTVDQALQLANEVRDVGYPPEEIKRTFEMSQKREKGRPADKRRIVLAAFDLRRQQPQPSWQQIANQLCTCGKSKHDWKCREAVRQGVIAFELILRKYQLL